ncbi:GNAT superfamily N-acetyltransferase [Chryseobacterium bernardetii]|jgi:GNAT superfamily N-acetyltransferase|uniref:Acetyltransferase (GNAT) family protein n=3 Tax=Chryseobacterium TaxID=59732 RepID=A0A543EH98_9FLAO|nr:MULTISPECIES: GNAT family N-acetyltransferase [Chryseobacterium]MDR6372986.1 GNAT superfamily N-acetyltransferase [Chryseobacterium vietnamense]MDR6443424.1 GNAT superfamily N-acetyltransferase [Chryseobacterium bernardetii]MDR6486120.1 GNAT superfamily N-acetyltransferase [Chryseobacterium vietnamense]TQM20869.1 acetyltransferase (GNAT) family protein [Chryseobacterium aquifrigidense]
MNVIVHQLSFINDKKMDITIKAIPRPSEDKRVVDLIHRLNTSLITISGESGSKSANLDDFTQEKALFLIAVSDEKAIACGGFRPLSSEICEIKRMFSLEKNRGLGGKILSALEIAAKQFDYKYIYLETRKKNDSAVKFYLKNDYKVIENYGIYIGREEAICFSKEIK